MEPDVLEAQSLRAKFEEARESASAAEVRAAAVGYYRARAAQGATQPEVAGELGVPHWTLAKWHQKHRAGGAGQQAAPKATPADCAALKQEVEKLGPRTQSRRFPAELKHRIAQWARGELARGVAGSTLANQVGVPWESLSRWLGRRRGANVASKLRAVRVVGNAPGAVTAGLKGPVLKSPGGFIVEGLDMAMLVEVLRRLG